MTLLTISIGLLLVGILAWLLHEQRKKISWQKETLEIQAISLLKLNEQLQWLNKKLEDRIDERTSQLSAQNQRISEYTFINAHKLRAPVASILGLIDLMEKAAPEEKYAILSHLKTCGEQLDQIIHELNQSLEGALISKD